MKFLTPLVYFCVAGVVASFAGSLYMAVQVHQEESKPRPNVFPTPAAGGESGAAAVAPPPADGLPTPAH